LPNDNESFLLRKLPNEADIQNFRVSS
jgi:hypothetical protein